MTLEAIANSENLSPKYLGLLWRELIAKEPSFPLDRVRRRWRTSGDGKVGEIEAEVAAWRDPLWNFAKIGSYRYGTTVRAAPKDPTVRETEPIKLELKPAPGQNEVMLYLVASSLDRGDKKGHVVWRRPRFEGSNLPMLALRDYEQFGPRFEIDYAALFANTARYLSAAVEAANNPKPPVKELAGKHRLDEAWLKRWITVLEVQPLATQTQPAAEPGRVVPAVAWQLLDEKIPANAQWPGVSGWKPKAAGLPIVLTNASDKTVNVPGRVSPHAVTMHPTPTEFVAAVWKSPIEGTVRVAAKVAHAHPACGNGVAWWLEKRTVDQSRIVSEGAVDLGKATDLAPQTLSVAEGDSIVLAIDAREKSHVCDLTEIALKVTEISKEQGRVWDLAADVADRVLEGNPHADSLGHKGVWSFVKGPAAARPIKPGSPVDANSILARWRTAAADPARRKDAAKLAKQLQALLCGPRPARTSPIAICTIASYRSMGPCLARWTGSVWERRQRIVIMDCRKSSLANIRSGSRRMKTAWSRQSAK